MIRRLKDIALYLVLLSIPAQAQFQPSAARHQAYFHRLQGKRISVVAHAASVTEGVHLVDRLGQFNIVSIMSPEHGFQSKAADGELIGNSQTGEGIPIISLYGKHKKPTVEDLAQVDVVVFELQDLGLRFYTYISTLVYVMEACAEQGVELIVLDRPNPFVNDVSGPVLDTAHYRSFIGIHPVPASYGMTIGEYARMVQGEGWIHQADRLNLTIVKCGSYRRDPMYPTIPPSPNLPNWQAVALYPSLCPLEATQVSIGRGTNQPFQMMGAPTWILDSLQNPVIFTPESCDASKYPKFEGETCYGMRLLRREMGRAFSIRYVHAAYQQARHAGVEAEFFKSRGFALRVGNDRVEAQLKAGWSVEEIEATWEDGEAVFRDLIRSKYLLY